MNKKQRKKKAKSKPLYGHMTNLRERQIDMTQAKLREAWKHGHTSPLTYLLGVAIVSALYLISMEIRWLGEQPRRGV